MKISELNCAVLVVLVFTTATLAQSPEKPIVFLEKAYFSPVSPLGTGQTLVFEAQPSVHYFVFNNLNDNIWTRKGGYKFAVPVSFVSVVRMFADASFPVRTPSYKPRILFQLFHLKRDTVINEEDTPANNFRLLGLSTGLQHYSNGQAGCTFQDEVFDDATQECRVVDDGGTLLLNTEDGSFSANMIQLNADLRFGWLGEDAPILRRALTLRSKMEWHPSGFLWGGFLSDRLAKVYGRAMLGLGVEYETRKWSIDEQDLIWRIDAWGQTRFGSKANGTDWSGDVELSVILDNPDSEKPSFYSLGVFLRIHFGNDYYNIHYQRNETLMQFGLMFDPGRLSQFNE